MLKHSVILSRKEVDLGFEILRLPSTGEDLKWSGAFREVCAIHIGQSSFIMKFETEGEPDYYHFKWGVPKNLDRLSPRWIPVSSAFKDPEMAIHSASLDLSDPLDVIESELPTS